MNTTEADPRLRSRMLATASAAQKDNPMANAFHQDPLPPVRPATIDRLMQATAALQRSLAGKASRSACNGSPTIDTVPAPRAFAATERRFPSAHPLPPAILILIFLSVAGLCHLFGGTMGEVRAGQRSRRYWWRLGEGESEQQVVP